MHIVALRKLESYWHRPGRSDTEGALKAWFAEAKSAQWTCPQDVKNQYAKAGIVANNRVVFNIKGNDHRLIVAIAYHMQYVYVKFIGTHAEYDRVDAAVVDQFKGV
jgi:mRNA interferase HigB